MPANLFNATPIGVLPQNLCTAFSESRIFPMLMTPYHDGTTERFLITDGVNNPASIRTWKLSRRLSASDLGNLRFFFEYVMGGLWPFSFYNPFEQTPGQPVGSNFDATGVSTQGRHICRFTNQSWTETVGISRTDAALEFMEVA